MRTLFIRIIVSSFTLFAAVANSAPSLTLTPVKAFRFDNGSISSSGWSAQPQLGAEIDDGQRHGESQSAKIRALSGSSSGRSAATIRLDIVIPPQKLDAPILLKVFVRGEEIGAGGAGVALSIASPIIAGRMTSESEHLTGSFEWRELDVTVDVDQLLSRDELNVTVAAGIEGQGTFWVSDVSLTSNGVPIKYWETPQYRKPAYVRPDAKVAQMDLTLLQIEALARLGKIWGFLKYHHPDIAAGRYDWDAELLLILPAVMRVRDTNDTNRLLRDWVESFAGTSRPVVSEVVQSSGSIAIKPAIGWIYNEVLLGHDLALSLQRVYSGRSVSVRQHHASRTWMGGVFIGNISFDNEDSYTNVAFPDFGYQVLALFRFWNVIEYWYPYRELTGEGWDLVLAKALPEVAQARSRLSFELALIKTMGLVKDGHVNMFKSNPIRPPQGQCLLPLTLRFVGRRAFVVSVDDAATAKLEVGDELLSLAGESISDFVQRVAAYYPASNEAAQLRDIGVMLGRGNCEPVRLVLRRDNRLVELTVSRLPSSNFSLSGSHELGGAALRFLSPDIAYMRLSATHLADLPKYLEDVKLTKGLIIDIRGYPAEYVVYALGSHLVTNKTVFAKVATPDIKNPGQFLYTRELTLSPVGTPYTGKVVVLVDEVTWSQGEFTAMALRRAPNAIVVGSTTSGSDGDVTKLPLPFGYETQISGNGYYNFDGSPTQQVGIIPDIYVYPTPNGIRSKRDEIVEAAIAQIAGSTPGLIYPDMVFRSQ